MRSLWDSAVSMYKAQDVSLRHLSASIHLACSATLRFDHLRTCLLCQLLGPAMAVPEGVSTGTTVHVIKIRQTETLSLGERGSIHVCHGLS